MSIIDSMIEPLEQRIAALTQQLADLTAEVERLREATDGLLYWLLRAHDSGHREGWEPGPSVDETMTALHCVLCNYDLDPCGKRAEEYRNRKPEYWNAAIEAALDAARGRQG